MPNRTVAAALAILALALPAFAQQGGTFTPDTTPTQGTNAGGPLGTQAIERPKNAMPNDVGKSGQDCEKMSGTVSGERPATAGAANPQPQAKCAQQ
ncbi:Hypothetical protein NGAL_HAMBI1145_20360 [Neorhizobium galegae bv. officinalis]|jgi:hypothetical protein|uniref:Secreted protein n=1 Tax=Neorhizobium galegae bv. officinalis TaxID=323656 RepID=A0A0T7FFV7_NEOGA|nr:hypothetical protein [Neorhizobium galegae]CDZ33898.1 Hypothetical protein NGAL_HAMBI1145_20360 [Neorhizobium galegae bv. officinalis]